MPLSTGTKLGPYVILAPIGAGGMGEVYRTRDERLKRDVAVKVVPASFAQDPERLRRFEQEAQAAGGLNHPNITSVYELGSHEGSPYIVTELLEGETLRARLSGGALTVRKATDYAIQIAKGLAAAHEKGIVHRDLKPENLFVTNDGRVKILDFGLAKLTQSEARPFGSQTNLPTATEPGVLMGTLGYMAPEQVKGKPADARSDIFAFGAILYEMLSGSRVFHRNSAAETMSAILREDPPDLSATNKNVQPGLERVVRHCLEKNPEERFHSAHDLAFDLEALSSSSSPAVAATPGAVTRKVRVLPVAAAALTLAAALAAGYFFGKSSGISEPPTFKQLTFRRGAIWSARFGSDEKTILTTAAWDGRPAEIYVTRPESPEARPFGLTDADVAAVSPTGDVAVLLRADFTSPFTRAGTLARVGATGGVPRELLEGVEYADFSPDGKDLAIVRGDGKRRLEFPPGKVIYESAGYVGNPRFSPKGDRIAFLDHPLLGDDGGSVAVIDLAGKKSTVSPVYSTSNGLAWSPDGSEIWYTAAVTGNNRALYAVRPTGGAPRTIVRIAGSLTLQDVSRDGRVLMNHDTLQMGMAGRAAGAAKETDLSWFDWSLVQDISMDGRTVLFTEAGEGGGAGYSVYVRGLDGSPALRLGEGQGQSLSPDGKSVLALVGPPAAPEIVIYPTGAGEARKIPAPGILPRGLQWVPPDGKRILVGARDPEGQPRAYLFDTQGGAARAVAAPGFRAVEIALDGRRFVCRGPDNAPSLCPLDGGEPSRIAGLSPTDLAPSWTPRGELYVRKGGSTAVPARVVVFDPATGREKPWRDIAPENVAGINGIPGLAIAPNGAYVYNYFQVLSTMYLVEGVK